MESLINKVLDEIFEEDYDDSFKIPLDNEAMNQMKIITECLSNSMKNMDINQWINTYLKGGLKDFTERAVAKGDKLPKEAALEHLILEILSSAVKEFTGRANFEVYGMGTAYANYPDDEMINQHDILSAIYEDKDFYPLLKHCIPLFPTNFANQYNKFNIPRTRKGLSPGFRFGLRDVLTALVNYYSSFGFDTLWDYQNKVGDLIVQRAKELNKTPTFGNLISSIYNNPQVNNIPWNEVFTKALSNYKF